jgi:hypothetical protein
VSTRLAFIGVLLLGVCAAGAQPIDMEQVATKSSRLGVDQISPNAQERASLPAPSKVATRAAPGDPPLSSRTSRKDSIDPEEIARVLGAGQANTIDAAAALASGAVAIDSANAPPTPPSDTEQEPSARAPVEPRAR